MGIKFLCPNGHKLNVKSFLAGKKGVCPKCGVSLRIPAASEGNLTDDAAGDSDVPVAGGMEAAGRPSGAAVTAPVGPAMPAAPIAAGAPAMPGPQPAAAVPIGGPVAARPAMPVAGAPVAGVPMAAAPTAMPVAGMPVAGMPPMPMAHAAVPAVMPPMPGSGFGAGDPIAEAPAATWYVRPPGGGQYGPARGDVMRKWIAEGRVSSDSLVWREGWADWRNAGQLFPNLAAVGGAGAAANPIAAIPKVTSGVRSASRYQAKQKSSTGVAIALLVMLALACVVLVGVLVYVLTNLK